MTNKILIIIFLTSIVFSSCTKTKEENSKVEEKLTDSKGNISSAGVKEEGIEFNVEYGKPRRIFKIEKEDLNNDGKREIIVFSTIKDTADKYDNYYNFDMLEIFSLNPEKKAYVKILSDTVDYSEDYSFEDLDGLKKKQIIITTNTGGNDAIISEGMFVYDMMTPESVQLVAHIDSGSPKTENLKDDNKKQIVVSDRYWGVMPVNEAVLFVSEIFEFESPKFVLKNSEYGEFYDEKIRQAKEKYYGMKKKVEMGMQPGNMAYPLYKEAAEVIVNYFAKGDMKGLSTFWEEEKNSLEKNLPKDEFLDLNNFIMKALPTANNA